MPRYGIREVLDVTIHNMKTGEVVKMENLTVSDIKEIDSEEKKEDE